MLSNPTNNLRNRQRQHQQQNSKPTAFDSVKVHNLPNIQKHGTHCRGKSSPQDSNPASTTNQGYQSTQQHILRETQQQRLVRPGQQFKRVDNDENYLNLPIATPLLTFSDYFPPIPVDTPFHSKIKHEQSNQGFDIVKPILIPFLEIARKKWVWFCCACNSGGFAIFVEVCPSCEHERCLTCDVRKKTRYAICNSATPWDYHYSTTGLEERKGKLMVASLKRAQHTATPVLILLRSNAWVSIFSTAFYCHRLQILPNYTLLEFTRTAFQALE
jgi:hypothetical protein